MVLPKFTPLMTDHGKNTHYLHSCEILYDAVCPRNKEEQTVSHLIFECEILKTQWRIIRNNYRRRNVASGKSEVYFQIFKELHNVR